MSSKRDSASAGDVVSASVVVTLFVVGGKILGFLVADFVAGFVGQTLWLPSLVAICFAALGVGVYIRLAESPLGLRWLLVFGLVLVQLLGLSYVFTDAGLPSKWRLF